VGEILGGVAGAGRDGADFHRLAYERGQAIQTMRQFQQLSRGLEARDFNVLESNRSYVSTWSIVQCVVILACGFVQVHFVKKLFDSEGRKVAGAKTAVRA